MQFFQLLTTAKNVARPVGETVAESGIKLYFPQRLQQFFFFPALRSVTSVLQLVSQGFAAPANENISLTSGDRRNETSCMKRCSVCHQ